MKGNGDLRRKVADLSAVLDIARAMAAEDDLTRLLSLIMDRTRDVMCAERCSLFLYDEEKKELWSKIAHDLEIQEIRFPVDKGIAGEVAVSRETQNIEDAYKDSRFNPEFDKQTGFRTRSILCMPMVSFKNKLVGVIEVMNKQGGGGVFSEYDEFLLGTLAAQAGVSLEHAELIESYVEKQKLKSEMDIAGRIQQSLLPDTPPNISGFDIRGWNRACDETGGDYFDFIPLDENRLLIPVGDVSGHGVGSALQMATARALVHAFSYDSDDVEKVLCNVNNILERDLEDDTFMTMLVGILDTRDKTLAYSSAGHDAPLIYKKATHDFIQMDSTGMILGAMPDVPFPVSDKEKLETGDIVVMFTDGIFEAMDKDNQPFGTERIMDIIKNEADGNAEGIIRSIVKSVEVFSGDVPQRDDWTVIVCKVT